MSDRLSALSAAVTAAKERARAMELEHGQVVAMIAAARDGIVEAHAVGDDAAVARLSKDREQLEGGAIRDAEERLEGARVAVSRAEVEVSTYAASNIEGLLRERHPSARAAVKAVAASVAALGQAQGKWDTVQADVAALLRLAGQNTGSLPRFPETLATLVRDARRAGGVDVPAPLPAPLKAARVIAED